MDMGLEDMEQTKREIEILKVCQHPNIIKFYEAFENEDFFYLIMEYNLVVGFQHFKKY